jgi:UDP-N-acetylmuramate dehydrogenase
VFKNPYPQHAGALIEGVGLKGFRIGGAEVSPKHANFIINVGHATSKDIKDVMAHVQSTVMQHYGIMLTPEVVFVEPSHYL